MNRDLRIKINNQDTPEQILSYRNSTNKGWFWFLLSSRALYDVKHSYTVIDNGKERWDFGSWKAVYQRTV